MADKDDKLALDSVADLSDKTDKVTVRGVQPSVWSELKARAALERISIGELLTRYIEAGLAGDAGPVKGKTSTVEAAIPATWKPKAVSVEKPAKQRPDAYYEVCKQHSLRMCDRCNP